ncbi:cilium assembly protein DZIP1L [Anopheles maculipalpis]|uniref:cilium assembly protein DZIP1L n=1 Tax=Anopheles maculipalpis TaxID=1496333 RepID=UPI002158CBD9|nr:cilium assembly protein DZIP1L [Anopheles maculipalpis]
MSYRWHHNFPKIAREAGFTIRELSAGHCIDWRFIASIDPYGIVSEQDYEKLDEFIPHISEVPIGNVLNNRILDPAIGKYFILAQFSIQYLLFCKQFLDETVLEIRKTIQGLQEENVRLEKMNKKHNEEVTLLQRKLHRNETMEHQHAQSVASVIYPCSRCTKNFISPELLNAHVVRKHANIVRPPDATFDRKPSTTDTNLINTIKLELEVKQLKERLNAAEKDLQNHRTKHHRCRVCSEDSSSAMEKPPTKVLHSIGIQSNLTDDKDLNDKEAQTQTNMLITLESDPLHDSKPPERMPPSADLISKSDLQTFLEEQKELFEIWKAGERKIFNQELAIVKQDLVDVIQSMEKSERNTPIPVTEESVWKDRYQELEKMYEKSQKQAQQTIASFEGVYAQKMEEMEKLLLDSRALEHDTDQHHTRGTHFNHSVPHHPTILKVVTLPTVAIEGESVAERTMEVVENDHSSNVNSSESEQVESGKEIRPTVQQVTKLTQHTPRVVVATPESDTTKVSIPISLSSQKALLISPKKQILSQFRARLKAIGVDPRSKQLFGEHLNAAYKALADRREVQKQKYNHFFVTRNQLLSKVDQLARGKVEETPQTKVTVSKMAVDQPILVRKGMHPSTSKVPLNQPRRKLSSSALELLPSKQKLLLPDMGTVQSTDSNVSSKGKISFVPGAQAGSLYKPTIKIIDDDIITVHADVLHFPGQEETIVVPNQSKRASISSYDQQVERLLHTPIKTIHPAISTTKKLGSVLDKENPPDDISGFVESVSTMQTKPVPKKRVLFNLDSADNVQSAGAISPSIQQQTAEEYLRSQQSYQSQKAKVDDESDWNISSFDEDK